MKKSKYSFIDFALPLYIVFAPYSLFGKPVFSLYILFIYSAIVILLNKNIKIYLHKNLFYFVLFFTVISTASILRRTSTLQIGDINTFLNPWVVFLIIGVTCTDVHRDKFYRVYTVIGIVAMITMYIQSIGLFVFNIPAVPIRLLPVQAEDAHFWGNFEGARPSAFFTEPQAYASYMLPLLVFAINKRKYLFSLLIAVSIFLSTSSMGILLVGIIFVVFIFQTEKWHYKFISIVVLGLLVIVFLFLPVFQMAVDKIFTTDFFGTNIRLTTGFFIYSTFDMPDLILGIGAGRQESYVENNLSYIPWIEHLINTDRVHLLGFSTAVSRILISAGVIPCVLFFTMFFNMFKQEEKTLIMLLVVIIISSFATTMLFNAWFLFYYLIFFACSDKDKSSDKYFIIKY